MAKTRKNATHTYIDHQGGGIILTKFFFGSGNPTAFVGFFPDAGLCRRVWWKIDFIRLLPLPKDLKSTVFSGNENVAHSAHSQNFWWRKKPSWFTTYRFVVKLLLVIGVIVLSGRISTVVVSSLISFKPWTWPQPSAPTVGNAETRNMKERNVSVLAAWDTWGRKGHKRPRPRKWNGMILKEEHPRRRRKMRRERWRKTSKPQLLSCGVHHRRIGRKRRGSNHP